MSDEKTQPFVIEPQAAKVKFTKSASGKLRTQVLWLEPAGEEPDTADKNLGAPRHPDFEQAMADLVPHALEVLELPAFWVNDIATAISVSYSQDKEGVRGATVTLQLSLKKGTTTVNTPHLPEVPYDPEGIGPCLTDEMVTALNLLEEEALAYAQGLKRGDLFGDTRVGADDAAARDGELALS